MIGSVKEAIDQWKSHEALAKGRMTFLPCIKGSLKQWKQAVVFQVGTGNLDLPRTPTVFDVSDELAKHQVWSIQLHKAYATAEL